MGALVHGTVALISQARCSSNSSYLSILTSVTVSKVDSRIAAMCAHDRANPRGLTSEW